MQCTCVLFRRVIDWVDDRLGFVCPCVCAVLPARCTQSPLCLPTSVPTPPSSRGHAMLYIHTRTIEQIDTPKNNAKPPWCSGSTQHTHLIKDAPPCFPSYLVPSLPSFLPVPPKQKPTSRGRTTLGARKKRMEWSRHCKASLAWSGRSSSSPRACSL